jgi:hypothetical protein
LVDPMVWVEVAWKDIGTQIDPQSPRKRKRR